MSKIVVLMFFVSAFVAGCSSMREGTTGKTRGDVLTAEEIATTKAQNAYDAVTLKRPFFLKSRGPRSLSSAPAGQTVEFPVVYLDGMYYGEIESLRNITVEDIKEIDYLDFNAATIRFGTGHSGGIILVVTKRDLSPLTPDSTKPRD
jgi:hypothetical protein